VGLRWLEQVCIRFANGFKMTDTVPSWLRRTPDGQSRVQKTEVGFNIAKVFSRRLRLAPGGRKCS
jgi:hypothetical protein